MPRTSTKTWLITGCSSGFGRALAEAALARGDHVMLTARDLEKLTEMAARYPKQARAMALDVNKPGDAHAVVEATAQALVTSASYRSDIPAFHADWFLAALSAGEVAVSNPYNRQLWRDNEEQRSQRRRQGSECSGCDRHD